MPWIIAAGTLGGAYLSSEASGEAASQQAGASREAIELQREMYEQQRKDLAPYRESGYDALAALRSMVGLPAMARSGSTAVGNQAGGMSSPTTSGAQADVSQPNAMGGINPNTGMQEMYNPATIGGGGGAFNQSFFGNPVDVVGETNPQLDWATQGAGEFLGGLTGPAGQAEGGWIGQGGTVWDMRGGPARIRRVAQKQFGGPLEPGRPALMGEDGGELVYNNQGQIQDIVGLNGPEMNVYETGTNVTPSMTTQQSAGPDKTNYVTPTNTTGQTDPAQAQPFDWRNTPGYDYRLQQALEAQEASAGARGGLFSGAAIKGREALAQNLATEEYQNVYNRLASIAGLGQTGVSQGVAAGSQAAGQMGSSLQNIGAAQAAGTMGQANAWSNAIGQLGFLYGSGAFS